MNNKTKTAITNPLCILNIEKIIFATIYNLIR